MAQLASSLILLSYALQVECSNQSNPLLRGDVVRGYVVDQLIGETSESYMYLVQDVGGERLALRTDKARTHDNRFYIERGVQSSLVDPNQVVPTLVEIFLTDLTSPRGRRNTVTRPFGYTLQFARIGHTPVSEHTAVDIVSQIAVGAIRLQEGGYTHNRIDYSSVAYESLEDRSKVVFSDLSAATPIVRGEASYSFLQFVFNAERVFEKHIRHDWEGTDKNWFVNTATKNDDVMRDFISLDWLTWSPMASVGMRNCRILEALIAGGRSNLDIMDSVQTILRDLILPIDPPKPEENREEWFVWAMTRADDDIQILNYISARRNRFNADMCDSILGTRLLYRYVFHNGGAPSSVSILSHLVGGQRTEEDFVIPRFPSTDRTWFPWAMKEEEDINGFIARPEFSPLDRIAIRSSRIFERLAAGKADDFSVNDSIKDIYETIVRPREPTTERSWFKWALKDSETDSDILLYLGARSHLFCIDGADGIILATRLLSWFQRVEGRKRADFVDVIKVYFQLQGVSSDTRFFDMVRTGSIGYGSMMGERLLKLANRVYNQRMKADLSILQSVLKNERFAMTDDSALYIQAPPSGVHEFTLIYLHGMGASGSKDWIEHIHPKTGGGLGNNVRVVIPQVRSTARNPKREWFEFIDDREPWDTKIPVGSLGNRQSLDEANESLLRLVDAEVELLGGDYGRIFVMGYSKGGQMALWLGLMGNRPLGGIINYLGCFPFFEIDSVSDAGKQVPVVHYHDRRDKIILFRFAEEGVAVAKRAGATRYSGITVSEVSGKDFHALSSKVLPNVKVWFQEQTSKVL